MEGDNNLQAIIGALHEQAHEISRRRRQQVQEDESSLKRVIDKLNLHSCSGSREGTASTEDIRKAYQKAREDRDEYKFQLNVCKSKIKELKEELAAVRLNQTQHNISIVADLSQYNERNSCAYTFRLQPGDSNNKNDDKGELSTTQPFSEESYNRELKYLHKTNQEYCEEIRKLKSKLMSQEALLEKLSTSEAEITILRKIAEEKQEKMMNMQIAFDEKLKNTKRDYIAQISALNNRIKDLETVRDSLNIELGAAQEEIRLLQLSLKKPVEEVTELGNCIDIPDKAVTNSQLMKKETSHEKEELLYVNTRREKMSQLQAIENVIVHPTSTRMSELPLIDRQHATLDEVKDLGHGVLKGTKRGQRGGKVSKKESAASQKEAKKMKSSNEKSTDSLQTIENESIDGNSSNTRKGARTRTVVNPRKKAIDSRTDTAVINNKQNKKLRGKLEADENVEPTSLEYSSPSLNGTMDKFKLPGGTSTPVIKILKKVQDDSRRANRRRNK